MCPESVGVLWQLSSFLSSLPLMWDPAPSTRPGQHRKPGHNIRYGYCKSSSLTSMAQRIRRCDAGSTHTEITEPPQSGVSKSCAHLVAQLVRVSFVHGLRGKQEGVVCHLVGSVDIRAVGVAVCCHTDTVGCDWDPALTFSVLFRRCWVFWLEMSLDQRFLQSGLQGGRPNNFAVSNNAVLSAIL